MQAFGRTPLTTISPKKTWEGALAGLGGCIATSVLLAKILCWPTSILRCMVYFYLSHCTPAFSSCFFFVSISESSSIVCCGRFMMLSMNISSLEVSLYIN